MPKWVCVLLQNEQNFVFDFLRNFNASCLQTMHPSINFFCFHCVEYMSELFNIVVGIIFRSCNFETVKLFILEIEIAGIVTFGTVAVFSATFAIFAVVAMVLFGDNSVTV